MPVVVKVERLITSSGSYLVIKKGHRALHPAT